MIKTGHCWCGDLILGNGQCQNRCSRWAEPGHLRSQERKRQERENYRRREERIFITQDDLRKVRAAVKKFDPIAAYMARQGRKSARKRYSMGGAK